MTTGDERWTSLFDALSQSEIQIALVVTGGGCCGVARCFRREGASRNFVDAAIPYSRRAVTAYLGSPEIEPSASAAMARALALAAMQRALRSADRALADSHDAAGIALVAALPTSPPRSGADRIHVAIARETDGRLWSLHLAKDAHTRESAETVADEMVFRALAHLVDHEANDEFFDQAGLELETDTFAI